MPTSGCHDLRDVVERKRPEDLVDRRIWFASGVVQRQNAAPAICLIDRQVALAHLACRWKSRTQAPAVDYAHRFRLGWHRCRRAGNLQVGIAHWTRSEEHTSELQSPMYL